MQRIIAMFTLLVSVSVFGASHIESVCYPPDGIIWKFEIYTDVKDEWDSSKAQHPPLSPRQAMGLATEFMKKVPLGTKMVAWGLSRITLDRISRDPEHWIYRVYFDAEPDPKWGPWNGPIPWFDVPVRFDGSIPKPKITKQE